jgi:hypothetical protein
MKLIANIGATPAIGAPIPEKKVKKLECTEKEMLYLIQQ